MVAFAEHGQPAAVVALEDALDADIAGGGQRGGGQPGPGGEAVLHPLDHGLELGGHQPAGLGGGHPQGVFEPGGVQAVQGPGRGGRGQGAEHHPGVPAARDHLQAAERLADPRPGLIAQDRAEQELLTGHRPDVRDRGEHGGQHQRVAVQRGQRMVVVQLETLDEAGVEHRRRRGAGGAAAPADQRAGASVVQGRDRLHALAGDGQLRADQGAGHAVQDQVLGVLAHPRRDICQRGASQPGSQPAGGPRGVGRGV